MLKVKTDIPYWAEFKKYQQFESVEELIAVIDSFATKYHLTKKVLAVLNTLKLHAKGKGNDIIGVTWMMRREIARKAKASIGTVDRAIEEFVEYGLVVVHTKTNELRGGKAPNVIAFVNPNRKNDTTKKTSNDISVKDDEHPTKPTATRNSEVDEKPYKNFNKVLNKNLKKKDIIDNINDQSCSSLKINEKLKETNPVRWVPKWFQDIFKPYHGDSPQIVADYWKTACVSAKQVLWCGSIKNVPRALVQRVWKNVVKMHKQNKIANGITTDAVRAYFYGAMLEDIDFLFKPSLQ